MSDLPKDPRPADRPAEATAPAEPLSKEAKSAIMAGDSSPDQPAEPDPGKVDLHQEALERDVKELDKRLQCGEYRDQPEERKALLRMATEAQIRLNNHMNDKQSKSADRSG